MGQISSSFLLDSDKSKLPPNLNPARSDWITAHAVVTKLAIVEIERSWKRFQQLGANSRGELTESSLKKHSINQDIFAKNILTTLKSSNNNVTFLTYLNCMKWAEISSYEDKIIGIFNLLNNGDPINRELVVRLIKRLYPHDKSRHEDLADILMTQLCGKKTGTISAEQFVEKVNGLPKETQDKLLSFLMVPNDLAEEARRNFTALSKYAGSGTAVAPQLKTGKFAEDRKTVTPPFLEGDSPDMASQMPSDGILKQVSDKIYNKDWQMLGNRLGFTQAQITEFDRLSAERPQSQVASMLKAWRAREGSAATCGVLEDKLKQCDMGDAAILLYP